MIPKCEMGHILRVLMIYSLETRLAHAFVTNRTSRAKAGGKGVKSIAYCCLRWRTELSDSRDQELR